jgi:putative colanic acid biosysnthesis UDP-glucose lipid carrier transferase
VPYSKISLQLTLIAALQMLVLPLTAIGMLILITHLLDVRFTEPYVALAIISALLCWIVMGKDQAQRVDLSSPLTLAGQIGLGWVAVVATLLLVGYATKTSDIFSRRALFLWFLATPPMLVAAALVLRQWLRFAMVSSSNARRVVIVGINRMSLELARHIQTRPEVGLQFHCFFDENDKTRSHARLAQENGFDVRDGVSGIREFVNTQHIDVVFIALPVGKPRTQALLDELRDTTSSVYLIPNISLLDLIQAQSLDIFGIPVIALCESPFAGIRGLVKRTTDVVFASLLLIAASPLMLAIWIAIKRTSPGPAIFRQDRYGLDGERIVVYKFRTMVCQENGDRIVQASRSDPRVTPVGRFLRRASLDELPQLVNVLQGRMSIVGPRPHAVAHNEQYRRLISGYMVRHKVVPGITGLAQVNGCRGETATLDDMKKRVDYDLEYLRHWCWLLDIKIMLKTLAIVIRDKHAY